MYVPETLINQAFLWNKISVWLCSRLYKIRLSPGPRQMVTFWGGKKVLLFQKILFGWFLHYYGAKCHLQQMDMNTGNQRGCACTKSCIWHQILSPGCQNSCCALSPPAIPKLCKQHLSLEKKLPSGGSPGLEVTPLSFEQEEPLFKSFSTLLGKERDI